MSRRTEALMMVVITGAWGLYFVATRGFWPASPLLVLAGTGALMYVVPTPAPEGRSLRGWAIGNLAGTAVALGATWFQSPTMLVAGLVVVVIALIGPWMRGAS